MIKKFCAVLLAMLFAQAASAAPQLDFITHNEVVVDAAPAAIWPHAVKPEEWKKGAKLVPVDGATPQLGTKFNATIDGTPIFAVQYVEFVPLQANTIRLNELDGTLIGYATLRLTPRGKSTVVSYDVYASMKVPPGITGSADWAKYLAENGKRFDAELLTLKTLSETAPAKRR